MRIAARVLGFQAHLFQQLADAARDGGLVGQQAMGADRLGDAEGHGLARVQRGIRVLEDVLDLLAQALAAGGVHREDVLAVVAPRARAPAFRRGRRRS
ncbi:hypothetical protein CNMCM8686_007890 [Aspergillus fumigatus]|nr:hypothetical protein CNMCM8686_007890 [Aspergillus fumigatus]